MIHESRGRTEHQLETATDNLAVASAVLEQSASPGPIASTAVVEAAGAVASPSFVPHDGLTSPDSHRQTNDEKGPPDEERV